MFLSPVRPRAAGLFDGCRWYGAAALSSWLVIQSSACVGSMPRGVSDLVGEKSPCSEVQLALVDGEALGLASLAVGAVADDFGEADRLSGG